MPYVHALNFFYQYECIQITTVACELSLGEQKTPIMLGMRQPLTCLFFLSSLFALGQVPQASPNRPKIALVLEGGGALGFAHIGVLQWMEEHHIPVDYVAGTSMGALVGGAYATGMSPDEVHSLVKTVDWDAVLRGSSDFRDLSFRRKEDTRDFPNSLEFGLKHGANFPAGFNSGQHVNFILDRIALPYSLVKSFDELPIPFRCLATDLVSRRVHVFKDGSLSLALRATMSIPGFFLPVRDEGSVYVDGGLLDNLPTDVAKEMEADKIIAVHLEVASIKPDEALSSVTTLAQAFSVVTAVNERRGMELADVLVHIDLTKFTSIDYGEADELVQRGYDAARENATALSRFALNDDEWQKYKSRREDRRTKSVPVPSFIRATGTTASQEEVIETALKSSKGQAIDDARLEHQLNILSGTGRFAGMAYRVMEADGRFGLHIRAIEKDYAPPTVDPIVVLDGSRYDSIQFSVGARFTFLDMGRPGAEMRSDVLAGSEYRLSTEYFRPLSSTKWFIAPYGSVDSSPLDLHDRTQQLAEYRLSQVNGGLDLGFIFNRFSEVRIGYGTGWQSYDVSIGNPSVLPTVSGRLGLARVRYVFDHLDGPIVPTNGMSVASSFDFFDTKPGTTDTVPVFQTTMQFFQPIDRADSVYLRTSGGTTFNTSATGVPPFSLGGPLQLSAYARDEIRTNQFIFLQVGYLREIGQLPALIGNKVYFNSLYEVARPYKTQSFSLNGFSDFPMDGAAGVLFETLLGPAYIGASWGDSGHRKIFFKLGRVF